ILEDAGVSEEPQRSAQVVLVERLVSKEIEIERHAMPEAKRNRSAAIKDKGQPGCRLELRPNFPLRGRKNVKPRLKASRHEMTCAAEPAGSLRHAARASAHAIAPTSVR